jgi:DME family drug/metabolite transporter
MGRAVSSPPLTMNSRLGMNNRLAIPAILFASVFWGTTGLAASTIPSIPPAVIGAATMGVGGILMAATAPKKTWAVLRTRYAWFAVIVGGLSIMTYTLVFYAGMSWAGVALGNVLALGSAPVFAGIIEWVVDRQRVSARWFVATVIVIVGGWMLATGRDLSAETIAHDASLVPLGIVMALIAGFAYAMYTFMGNRLMAPRGQHAPLNFRGTISAMQLVSAIPLMGVLAFSAPVIVAHPEALPVLLYLAIFPTAIGHSLLAYSLGSLRASVAGVYSLMEPVVAVLLAVTFIGEVISPSGWVGFGLVLLGIAYLSMPGSQVMPWRLRLRGYAGTTE